MTATRNCPACGSPLPADAPAGLCPRCLLAGGFDTAASPPAGEFDPPAIAELAPLFPQLEIIELLAAGGMGAVYKARQPNLDRLVALKVLPPNDDPSFTERFTREARTLAKLNHPGIVHIYDFGQAGGHSYIVMEYVEGVNLRQAERAGTMTPAEALAIVPQICAALQFAHEAGVVHRDIKPENVLLDPKGRVKIADFGLAKLLDAAGRQHLTGTHQAMGTLHYMAPEQWEKPAAVDHRADIYSLGVVFYELLTGELPLGRFAPPSEKVQVDVRLDQVVLRALEKEPERRYQQASEVKTDVERIAAKPMPATHPEIESPHQRRSSGGVVAFLFILASVFLGPVWLIALPTVWGIARKQKRSMVSVVDDALHFLRMHQIATWTVIVCLAGVANAFWLWHAANDRYLMERFFWYRNYPVLISAAFPVLGIFFFVTAQLPQLRLWRAGVGLAGGATLAMLAAVFFHEYNFNNEQPGPLIALCMPIGLMVLGAIELRGFLVNRSRPLESSDGVPVLPTAGGGPSSGNGPAAVVRSVPRRLNEPPPLPAGTLTVRPHPGFWRYVGLPVIVVFSLWLVAVWAESSGQGWHQTHKPTSAVDRPVYVRTGVGHAVENSLFFLGILGPLVGAILFIRWLWLVRRQRRAVGFWIISGALGLVLASACSAAAFWIYSRLPVGPGEQFRDWDGHPWRQWQQLLNGTWKRDGGQTITFKEDGTFEQWDGNRSSGPYRWIDNDHILARFAGNSQPKSYRVTVNEDMLTLVWEFESEGGTNRVTFEYSRAH